MKMERSPMKVERNLAKAERSPVKVERDLAKMERSPIKVERKPLKEKGRLGLRCNFIRVGRCPSGCWDVAHLGGAQRRQG